MLEQSLFGGLASLRMTGDDGLDKVAVDTRADRCSEVLVRPLLPSSTPVLMTIQKYMRAVLLFKSACEL